ncbi:MAG: helix-turn-helix transcriptional regulator [Candidatus Omnitrophica bacterium]|nr:helix-turn-helix transcriptional regulator [Candidatus Omnitrophota bacterium]
MKRRTFAQIFEDNRRKNKLSFRALSQVLGVSNVTLVRYAQGKKFPPIKTLSTICKLFKFDLRVTNQLIQSQKALNKEIKKFTYQNVFSELRRILLTYYSKGYGKEYSSLREIENKLSSYPFHPIEKRLLKEVYKRLAESGLISPGSPGRTVRPDEDPLDFFKKLTFEGKKVMLQRAKFEWTFNARYNHILFTAYSFEKPGESKITKLLIDEGLTIPKMPLHRLALIDLYSLGDSKFKKSYHPYLQAIIKEINNAFFHPIEEKILFESYKYLTSINLVKKYHNYGSYFILNGLEGIKELKNNLEFWHFDENKQILTIAFKTNKNKPLIKRFSLWYELNKK